MSANKLVAYGFTGSMRFDTAAAAAYWTYQTRDGRLVPTPLDFPGIDRRDEVRETVERASAVMEIGCGIGRNMPWIMDHSAAHFYGVEPNADMFRFFWDVQDRKHAPRVTLSPELFPETVKADVVLTVMALQHLAVKPPAGAMDHVEITREVIRRNCRPGTLWVHFESECDGDWLNDWTRACGITPLVYWRNYDGIPELNHRLSTHHLIVWRVTEEQIAVANSYSRS